MRTSIYWVSNQLISLASRELNSKFGKSNWSPLNIVSNQLISLASRECGDGFSFDVPNESTVSNQLISLASRETNHILNSIT